MSDAVYSILQLAPPRPSARSCSEHHGFRIDDGPRRTISRTRGQTIQRGGVSAARSWVVLSLSIAASLDASLAAGGYELRSRQYTMLRRNHSVSNITITNKQQS